MKRTQGKHDVCSVQIEQGEMKFERERERERWGRRMMREPYNMREGPSSSCLEGSEGQSQNANKTWYDNDAICCGMIQYNIVWHDTA